jgi:poly-beta-1,6-N-acetyl-D-glucosamine synthase
LNILEIVLTILFLSFSFVWLVVRPASVLVDGLIQKRRGAVERRNPMKVEGVSMIVPCHNESETIEQAVLSVLSQERDFPLEIILIENNSTDATYEVICKLAEKYPEVVATTKKTPAGMNPISYSLNHGISLCSYPIVVRMDADTRLPKTDSMIRAIEPVVSGRAVTTATNVRVTNLKEGLITRLQSIDYFLAMEMDRRSQRLYNGVLCCSGALQVFKLEDIRNMGGYSVETQIGEDMELTFRFHELGKVEMTPEAVSHTDVPPTWRELAKQRIWWMRIGIVTLFLHKKKIGNRRVGRHGMLGLVALPVKLFTTFQSFVGIIVKSILSVMLPHTDTMSEFLLGFAYVSLVHVSIVTIAVALVAPVAYDKQGACQWWLVPVFSLIYQPWLALIRFYGMIQAINILLTPVMVKMMLPASVSKSKVGA